ncbi:MAG: type III secretion system effector protein [Oscillospiraceae bacterium]|nr:type III secretion system effector protein [Oscillospiraceae bacterium]
MKRKLSVKSFILGMVAMALICSYIGPALADNLEVLLNAINIRVNGVQVARTGESMTLSNGDEVPFSIVYQGTTYLPLARLADITGMDAVWEPATGSAVLKDKPAPVPSPAPGGALDMSSSEAFIRDAAEKYSITLTDGNGYLSGPEGRGMMEEIDRGLALFSPAFIQTLASAYADYGARFILQLDRPSREEYGYIEWDGDLTISLRYDRDPEYNGITASVLAHELGHAVHYIVEEAIGEQRSEREIGAFNGRFSYAGNRYARVWNASTHGTTFAYDYSLYDYYEDVATIFELLVREPGEMRARLSDPRNKPLRDKTEYIRDMTYRHISPECAAVFAPLGAARAVSPDGSAPLKAA